MVAFTSFTSLASLAALFALPLALAQSLQVQTPSEAYYWVASVNNTLQWTGSGPLAFSVWLSNSNAQLMAEEVKLKSVVKTVLNRLDVNPGTRPPGIGYIITLKGINADSTVYGTSSPFEIHAWGSPMPGSTPTVDASPPAANNANTDAPAQTQPQDQNQTPQPQPNQPDQGQNQNGQNGDQQTPTEAQPSPTATIPSAAGAQGAGSLALAAVLACAVAALI